MQAIARLFNADGEEILPVGKPFIWRDDVPPLEPEEPPPEPTPEATSERRLPGILGDLQSLLDTEGGPAVVRKTMSKDAIRRLATLSRKRPADWESFLFLLAKADGVSLRDMQAIQRAIRSEEKAQRERRKEERRKRAARTGIIPREMNDPEYLATCYLDRHPHTIHYRESFFQYDGRRWVEQPDDEFSSRLNAFCTQTIAEEVSRRMEADPSAEVEIPVVTPGLVNAVRQAVSGKKVIPRTAPFPCLLTGAAFGEDNWRDGTAYQSRRWVSVENGILDIDAYLEGKTSVLLHHTPAWFSPTCLPFPFDPRADCPGWKRFLERNLGDDPGKAGLLQEWFGYTTTHDTSMQKFLMMVGKGSNGKSVVLAVQMALAGAGNYSTVPLEKFREKFSLAGTAGKLVNVMAEVGKMDPAAEGTLKAFVVGDQMDFEQKFKPPFVARPTARLVIATNKVPPFTDTSDGIYRRMLLLQFDVKIPEGEKVAGMTDPDWWREKGELPGILNWALAGLARLRKRGRFDAPESCRAAVKQHRDNCNPARLFLDEHYRPSEDPKRGVVSKPTMYASYAAWCKQNGHSPVLASNKFGEEVFDCFPGAGNRKCPDSGKRVNAYLGIEEIPPGER